MGGVLKRGKNDEKLTFQSRHKFVIAFENSSSPGYSTEKIVQAFAAKTVPIYWGDPEIDKCFNEKAFINCHKFPTFEDVVEYVKIIDADDELYMRMLRSPALVDLYEIEKEKYHLRCFLEHIIEEPYDAARRRGSFGCVKSYSNYMKKCNDVMNHWLLRRMIKRIQFH